MKKILLLLAIAITCCSIQNSFSIRQKTVQGIVTMSFFTAVAIHAYSYYKKTGESLISSIVASTFCSALINSGLYNILNRYTADNALDTANEKMYEISYWNPIPPEAYTSDNDLSLALKEIHHYWFINSKREVIDFRTEIIKAIDLINQAKDSARHDIIFLNRCNASIERGKKMLDHISRTLRVIDKGIAEYALNKSTDQ